MLTWLAAWALLHHDGVGDGDVLSYSLYIALGLVLPGTLSWRMLVARGRRPMYADVACGTALAYCIEMLVYLVVRAAGLPLLLLVWPVLAIVVSVLPRFRDRCWRPRGIEQARPGVAWSLAGLVTYSVAWTYWFAWSALPADLPGLRYPYVDLPYQLSLVGELRHHVPPDVPMVAGEPLAYQWFTHAEVAATSWGSGVEPIVLLMRLAPLGMIVTGLLVCCALAARLARRPWAGPVAGALLVVVGPTGDQPSVNPQYLGQLTYLSTTQSYGLVVGAALVVVMVEMLGRRRVGPGPWTALTLSVVATSGAKGTFLPIVVAGLVGAVVLAAVWRRAHVKPIATMLVLVVVVLLVVQRLVYGGSTQALELIPFRTSDGFATQVGLETTASGLALGTAFYLLVRLGFAAGLWGLVRQRAWRDPRAVFLVGYAVAGIGCTLVFWHLAQSQFYFLRSVPIVLAAASAWGLARLVPRRPSGTVVSAMAVCFGVGVMTATALTLWRRGPDAPTGEDLVLTFLAMVALVVVVPPLLLGVMLAVARRGRHLSLLAVVAALGVASSSVAVLGLDVRDDPARPTWDKPPASSAGIAPGGIAVARWLRDHSDPDDVVATNTHCTLPGTVTAGCDNRRFWMAGYTERRFVLEGWAYSPQSLERATREDVVACCLPFWAPARQQVNDAVFTAPTPDAVRRLQQEYGARWLLADLAAPDLDLPALEQVATVRHRGDHYVVLEIAG